MNSKKKEKRMMENFYRKHEMSVTEGAISENREERDFSTAPEVTYLVRQRRVQTLKNIGWSTIRY